MSGSGRKDFDVKHILRLRWKLFSHPSPAPGGPAGGGCLQQDGSGSFEHWGPSQSRLLKSQEKGSVSTFWKKTSSSSSSSSSSPPSSSSSFNPLNGTLLPVATRLQQGAPGQGTQQPARTLFYVESLEEEEVPGMDFPGPHDKGLVLQELKVEPANSSQATGEGCGHRLTATSHSLTPQSDMDSSSSEEFYQAVHHAEQTFRKMESYLKQQQLCDVILIVGNRKIPAHRLVLSSVSDYFAAMFTSDVCEAKQEEIKMEGIDPNALWDLVQFAYTGCLELKEDTIENLLAAACLLQLPQVVEVCCHFLMKLLHPSNCLGIRAFADAQGCIELMKVAHSYTMENIMEVMRNQEFLLLPAEELHKLLASDDVNVPDEETIFHALMMWVKYDMQRRCNDLSMLLAFIRLPLLPPQILADLENHALFKNDLECQKLILEAMKYHLLPERRTLMQSPRTKPRKSTVGTLYAVGGMDNNKGATTIEKYDLRTNLWIQAGMMNGRRLQFGVAVIDDKLFVIGGRDGLKTLNTVECYNPKTKTWTVLPPMSTHRHGLGVTVLEGPIYAVGGHDGWSYLNTVERWDPQSQQWTFVASMSIARSTVGVAALNGKLYSVGGRDGSSCLSSMEYYDPHTNKWNVCAPMCKRRGGVGVATCDGFLYAVGGHDAPASNHCSRLLDYVERYDPKTDTWTMVAPLSMPRDAVGVCLLGDRLYAVGGYDGQTYLNTMESYDPQTNEWTQMASLNIGRAGACVVVIKQP
ncbi:kelch-like protein 1 isoform X1 [Mirounga angustirostris]|uniref:kelch-like protein 1 isoform X1 n=1 Tax=Phoca vitulina TaxID=9720 RepID=UPI0013963119|nr:kelch-like protein 1 isoform X1 [Phoca vitulina]XP_034859143.1 kelch-like protein 1 isoform X1 [Mirounga leonina]XP_045723501.1 kelch-like protein 1 isoform X1 [Mirounga angustirostris]